LGDVCLDIAIWRRVVVSYVSHAWWAVGVMFWNVRGFGKIENKCENDNGVGKMAKANKINDLRG